MPCWCTMNNTEKRTWGEANLWWLVHRPFTGHLMNTGFLKFQASGWWSVGCNIAGDLAAKQQGNMDMKKVAETFNTDTNDQSWIQWRDKDKQSVKKEPFLIGNRVIYRSILKSDSSDSNLLQHCTRWISVQGSNSCQACKHTHTHMQDAFFLSII